MKHPNLRFLHERFILGKWGIGHLTNLPTLSLMPWLGGSVRQGVKNNATWLSRTRQRTGAARAARAAGTAAGASRNESLCRICSSSWTTRTTNTSSTPTMTSSMTSTTKRIHANASARSWLFWGEFFNLWTRTKVSRYHRWNTWSLPPIVIIVS